MYNLITVSIDVRHTTLWKQVVSFVVVLVDVLFHEEHTGVANHHYHFQVTIEV